MFAQAQGMFAQASDALTNSPQQRRFSLGYLLLLATLVCGCDSAQSRAPAKAPEGPRQRFSRVVERFRDYYRGSTVWLTTPVGNDGIEHASFRVVVDDVTFQFDPPKGTTKNLTAEVTVLTSAYYQMNTQFLAPEDTDAEEDEAPEEMELLSQDEQEPKKKKQPLAEDWGADTNRTVKTYDFAYIDGGWELKTTDLEEGVRLAFEYALKDQ